MHILDTSLPVHYDTAISSDGQVALINFKIVDDKIYCKAILVATPQRSIDININSIELTVKITGEALIYDQSVITPNEDEEYLILDITDTFDDIFWQAPDHKSDKSLNLEDLEEETENV